MTKILHLIVCTKKTDSKVKLKVSVNNWLRRELKRRLITGDEWVSKKRKERNESDAFLHYRWEVNKIWQILL